MADLLTTALEWVKLAGNGPSGATRMPSGKIAFVMGLAGLLL